MITKILTITILSSILFLGCGKKEENQEAKQNREIQTTQEEQQKASGTLTLKTTDGNDIKLTAIDNGIKFENYDGKVVLLDFFATWCPPCRAEIPHLVDIQKSYKENVQIIGILMEESKTDEDIEFFKEENKMNFPITNSPANFALSDALGGIKSLPTMVMYDKNGEYFTHYVGAVPQEMIEADIQKALTK